VVFCTDYYIGSGHELEKGDDGSGRHSETQHASQHQAAHIYMPQCSAYLKTYDVLIYEEVALASVVNNREGPQLKGC
jgi:hypothetical protein